MLDSCFAARILESRLFLLRAKSDQTFLIGLQKGTFQQVDTIRDSRKDSVQAFLNRLGLTRQIDDQRPASDHGGLPGENGGWDFFQ